MVVGGSCTAGIERKSGATNFFPASNKRAEHSGLKTATSNQHLSNVCSYIVNARHLFMSPTTPCIGRQACSSQIQYLSNSTKITTIIETAMLSMHRGISNGTDGGIFKEGIDGGADRRTITRQTDPKHTDRGCN